MSMLFPTTTGKRPDAIIALFPLVWGQGHSNSFPNNSHELALNKVQSVNIVFLNQYEQLRYTIDLLQYSIQYECPHLNYKSYDGTTLSNLCFGSVRTFIWCDELDVNCEVMWTVILPKEATTAKHMCLERTSRQKTKCHEWSLNGSSTKKFSIA